MTDYRLVGTNPEDGQIYPIAVTSAGLLKTSIGKIEAIPNDVEVQGKITATSGQINGDLSVTGQVLGSDGQPIGEDGFELPPNPEEGQVLGWQGGELVWMDGGGGGFFFDLDLLVVGGGGAYEAGPQSGGAGGGAGGLYQTRIGYFNPGPVAAEGPLRIDASLTSPAVASVVAGAPGAHSSFSIGDFNVTMNAGGAGGNRQHGASGGGGQGPTGQSITPSMGGQGIEGQGFSGADGVSDGYVECALAEYQCHTFCMRQRGGAGGGAGGPADGVTHGPGLDSDITGQVLAYAVGGNGAFNCHSVTPPAADGLGFWGCGGSQSAPAGSGVVVLRYPSWLQMTVTSGTATREDMEVESDTITTLSNGTAEVSWAIKNEVVMGTLIDYLRRLRD